jgi:hypothetical protein
VVKRAGGRISVDEAFQRLRAREEPFSACERLNAALRAGKVRLWADTAVVSPSFFNGHLYVGADVAPDGRCTATMAMTRAVELPSEWTVSGDDVDALLASKSGTEPKRRSGGRRGYNWDPVNAVILELVFDEGPPSNFAKFANKVRKLCEDHGMELDQTPDSETIRHKLPVLLKHILRPNVGKG